MLFVVLLIQIVDKSNQPMFDVQYKEKRQQFSPDAITEMIYRKMLGRFCSGDQALLDPFLLKGWQSDNLPEFSKMPLRNCPWPGT